MRRDEVVELHFITHIENVPSILRRGILSHNRSVRVARTDISMSEVQDLRKGKRVPGGRLLHDYANVYSQARNPMMSKRCYEGLRDELVVLRVGPGLLELPNVVVTDGNAAVGFTAFRAAATGLGIVDKDLTFARRWTHEDTWEYRRRKAASCAEVLVPDVIEPKWITGAYVATRETGLRLRRLCPNLPIRINRNLFFT